MKRIVLLLALSAFSAGAATVAIKNARIIDGTGRPPLENATLVVQGDKIVAVGKAAVPKGAKVIDARGNTLIPGLISAHSHVGLVVDNKNSADGYTRDSIKSQLLQYQSYGVTSIMALGLNRDLVYQIRDEQHQGKFPGASLYTAGRGVGAPDGAPPVPVQPDQVYRPHTVEEAVAMVRETATHHPDMLKIWVDDVYGKFPKIKPEVYQAAIEEAHKNNIRVAAHVFYLADAKSLLKSGIDAFAHGIRDQPVDAELIDGMKARGVFYVATFTVDDSAFLFAEDPSVMQDTFFKNAVSPKTLEMLNSAEYKLKVASDPNTPKIKSALANGLHNLKTLHDAGVRIAFGTDSGAQPARIPGWAEHHELEMLVRAGLTPMEALVAATKGSAAMIGASDRGTLETGKRADLVILGGNPLDDIRNTRKLVSVWNGGHEIKQVAK